MPSRISHKYITPSSDLVRSLFTRLGNLDRKSLRFVRREALR